MQAGLRELDVDLEKTDFFITHMHADHLALVSRLVTDTSKTYFNRPDAEIIKTWSWWESMIHYARIMVFQKMSFKRPFIIIPATNTVQSGFPNSLF
jgi:glyoxylase-like metal-dependent hydrolase (beta-lactamase superfamily II)